VGWCDCAWDVQKAPGYAVCTTCGKTLRDPGFDDLTREAHKCNARKRIKIVK
jgi:hypothetical protein